MDDLGAFHHIFPTMLFAFPSTPCWDNFTSCSQDTTVATNSPLFNSRVSRVMERVTLNHADSLILIFDEYRHL